MLVAPPGAGKTTRVPLALLDAPWLKDKKIIVLEPRRIAARASAERMAKTMGERVGETVGYRVRFGSKVSRATRIEVVTEGIFSRQILDDPELSGVAAVLFDEFHERSLDADLGLALARDAQTGLREDLRILVMSATLDGARVAKLLGDAPVIASEGRAFPVETRYLGRKADAPLERQMADAIATRAARRSRLGAGVPAGRGGNPPHPEFSRRAGPRRLQSRSCRCSARSTPSVQDRAIAPAPKGHRKVVLATSIAETSLTIEGVRIVVDSGMARVPRYEPDIGLTRLETVRASRAAVDQRRGRAGRTEPGVCYRLWDEPQTASLAAYTQPEILSADLSSLVLDLAQWGVSDPATLAFLDPPPAPALKEARSLLARTRRARCRRPDHGGRQEPARAGAAAAAGADDRGFASRWARARKPPRSPPCSPSAALAATASISMSGSISSAATVRNAPAARAAWRSAGPRRWRPLARREGPHARCTPLPAREEMAARLHRRHAGLCLSRIASRATAAMAVLCSPTGAALRWTRPRRWRARPISRSPN